MSGPLEKQREFSPAYRNYALGLLFVGYIVNFVDRSILSLLLEPIKLELALTDSQLGLLGGLAFCAFLHVFGYSHRCLSRSTQPGKILAVSMVIWSAMTALCGLATNFWMLLMARIGVGVGEAGASPPSHSLISDYFPVDKRATALSIYALGIPVRYHDRQLRRRLGRRRVRLALHLFLSGYSRHFRRDDHRAHPTRAAKGASPISNQHKMPPRPHTRSSTR